MTIEKRSLGRTGHRSSVVIFGSAALKAVDQGTADRVLDLLFEYGVNHIERHPDIDAELRIGLWMDRHRDAFFLATKSDQWSFEGAKRRSGVRSSGCAPIASIFCNSTRSPILDDWEQALSPGGALDAVLQARGGGWSDASA